MVYKFVSFWNGPNLFNKSKTHFTHIRTSNSFGKKTFSCVVSLTPQLKLFSFRCSGWPIPYNAAIDGHRTFYWPNVAHTERGSISICTFKKTILWAVVSIVYRYTASIFHTVSGFFIKNLAHGTNKTAIYFELKRNQSKGFGAK